MTETKSLQNLCIEVILKALKNSKIKIRYENLCPEVRDKHGDVHKKCVVKFDENIWSLPLPDAIKQKLFEQASFQKPTYKEMCDAGIPEAVVYDINLLLQNCKNRTKIEFFPIVHEYEIIDFHDYIVLRLDK